jgi:membrane protease YdiL (CAAX protease family)
MQRNTRAIVLFLALALGFSVCYWATIRIWPKGSLFYPFELFLWALFRGFGPLVAAFIAAYYLDGRERIKRIFSSLVRWKIQPRWYALAFLWPVVAVGAGVLAAHFFSGVSINPATGFVPRLVVAFFMMAIVDGPLGEEIGWRGFLLPELLRKINPVVAGIIVGCIWWMWHIPLYIGDGKSTPWLLYLVHTIALSLIFTWFFLRTKESTFFAIFLHDMSNYPIYLSHHLFPQVQAVAIGKIVFLGIVVLLGICAALSMLQTRERAPVG